MKKILNERLMKISAYIHNNDNIVDIGCDHGLLGIYLSLTKENTRIISSDINKEPLVKAYENALKYNVLDKIEIKQGDGLKVIDSSIDTVVISGMGSINIVNILKDIKNYPHIKKLILSPNNDFSYLRREITGLGFKINKEEMVYENNKYYLISEFIKGNENIDYFFGKLDINNNINKEYFYNIYNKNKEIINKLNDKQKLKKEELIKENKKINELLKID